MASVESAIVRLVDGAEATFVPFIVADAKEDESLREFGFVPRVFRACAPYPLCAHLFPYPPYRPLHQLRGGPGLLPVRGALYGVLAEHDAQGCTYHVRLCTRDQGPGAVRAAGCGIC